MRLTRRTNAKHLSYANVLDAVLYPICPIRQDFGGWFPAPSAIPKSSPGTPSFKAASRQGASAHWRRSRGIVPGKNFFGRNFGNHVLSLVDHALDGAGA